MKKIYAIIASVALLAFPACQEDSDMMESNVGYLTLEVGTDKTTITKAEEVYDPKQIAVQITDETGKVIKETDDYTTWTEAIALTPGKYRISASSAGFDGKTAAWDKPYYAGLDSVTIVKGESVSKEVVCTLANVLVTVKFDDAFKAAFKSASIVVKDTTNASNNLSFDLATAESKKGYFPVTGLFAELAVTNQKDQSYSKTDTIKDVKARDNVILHYKVAESEEGSSNINITLDGTTRTFYFTIGVPTTAKTTLIASEEVNAWSSFAYLEGRYTFVGIPDESKFAFEYQKDGESEWTKVSSLEKGENNTFTAKVSGLEPATKYAYRLVYGNEEYSSETAEFTTEAATALYNGGFDNWYNNDGTWYAIAEADATSFDNYKGYLNSFWDSGNKGVSMMSKNPTQESTDGHTGSAAELKSQFIGAFGIGKFAAGNIYTGHYYETIMSPMGAKLFFGQPFTSRPTQLKGWFKYTRGTTVDYGDDPYKSELQGTGGDQCSVYIALADNEGLDGGGQNYAFQIDNTLSADDPEHFKYKNTIDFSTNNPNIIAYGTLTEAEAKGTGEWQQFTIDLKYRDLTRTPKYIIVVASASKYGDYFTGSTSSVMYIDDFELVYGDTPVVEQ